MATTPRTFAFTNGDLQGPTVAYAAGSAPTKAEFDALIDALVAAGILAPAAEEG